ncbi:MAG: SAM-dependent methyltransferase, partial [Pseudomonadota bacterium]
MMDAPSRRFGDGNGDAPTPLARQLVERIRASGPLSVRAYMDACLHDPHYGYYRHAQAVGADGDFITAPEISQVFGELIGGWAVYTGQQLATQVTPGATAPVGLSLIEVGPGRGTLMHDMLRVIDQLPTHAMDVHAHLVERNPTLEAAQRQRLTNTRVPLHWHDDIAAALAVAVARGPQAPVLIIANEFLDAFAIDQWVYDGAAWRARTIDVADAEDDADADAGDDRTPSGLRFSQGPVRTYPPALSAALQAIEERDAMAAARLSPGTILQTGVAPILAELSAYVDSNSARATPPPLAALFLDYGFARTRFGDSLQAVRSHAYEHPLASPGAADLTAH